jgi:hypothetical protein
LRRHFRVALLALLAVWGLGACTSEGPRGPEGPQGPQGLQGPPGTAGALPPLCTPGESFCEGSRLWSCTKLGVDAVLESSCVDGSATNPNGCFSDLCPPGKSACCRPTKPLCRWSFTSPAMSGSYYTYAQGQTYCVPPSACTQDPNFKVTLDTNPNVTMCSAPEPHLFSLQLKRPLVTPGEVISLPSARVLALGFHNTVDNTRSCAQWTGTITWSSEVPSWSISLDITCAEPGKSHIKLVGTLSGDS